MCLHNRQELGRRSPVSDVLLRRRPRSTSRHSSSAAVVLDLQCHQLRGHRQRGARRGFPGGLSAAGPGTPLVPVCALFAAGLDRSNSGSNQKIKATRKWCSACGAATKHSAHMPAHRQVCRCHYCLNTPRQQMGPAISAEHLHNCKKSPAKRPP